MASQAFDVSDAILAFLADRTRSSFELPHMTTGQRKQTKKLVEQYPELTCESFGFGQERQLHLFKRREEAEIVPEIAFGELSCEAARGAVSVKNTLIDDFAESSSDKAANVTTMPPALSRILLDVTSGVDGKHESATPSTAASSVHSATASATPTPRTEDLPMQIGLATPVRNTFIHYAQPADQRIVQSMPHSMFGQCLITELLGNAVVKTPDADKAPAAAPQTVQELRPAISSLIAVNDIDADTEALAPGAEVVIIGLSKLPTFNGLKGTIQSFDEETARFSILLIEPAGGHKWVKVKRENLDAAMPLPPQQSPRSYIPEVQVTPTWEERSAHPLSLTALV